MAKTKTIETHGLCPYVVIHSIEISYCAILDLCTKSEKFAEELDLCTKSEKITNRTFVVNWKIFSEELDLCTKSEKITNRTFVLNWKNFQKFQKVRIRTGRK